jgi:hypothetical protein
MLPCLNKKLFGFDCMGCGIQRAISLFFQGEYIAAFKMYPAIYTLILLAIVLLISIFYKFKVLNKIINALAIASIIIIIINFTVNNLI